MLDLSAGVAPTLDDAEQLSRARVLQVLVGQHIDRVSEAALLTAINVGARAFGGGVHVRLEGTPALNSPWAAGQPVDRVVDRFGGTLVDALSDAHPTIVIANEAEGIYGSIVSYLGWRGWAGGASPRPSACSPANPLAGVLASGIALAEAFNHTRQQVDAGRRTIGVSLWRPDLDWRDDAAIGPDLAYLPEQIWIAGLGHLGQAFCWALGFLPYERPEDVNLILQDFDMVKKANHATQALVNDADIGRRKTRVVADRLEDLGFRTRITERRFDEHTKRGSDEPSVLLAGFDDPRPRAALSGAGFDLVVDAGLGGDHDNWFSLLLHAFPSDQNSADIFGDPPEPRRRLADQPGWQDVRRRLVEGGASPGDAECGMMELAGQAVAVAFVGTIAACFVIGHVLRHLAGGQRFDAISYDVGHRAAPLTAISKLPPLDINPGWLPPAS